MIARRFVIAVFVFGVLTTPVAYSQETTEEGDKGWVTFKVDDLTEWSHPGRWWKAENGMIVADSTGLKKLPKVHYLVWNGSIKGDFELSLQYRIITDRPQDAGVNFRVERPFKKNLDNLPGYQAELDTAYLYDTKPFIQDGMRFGHIHDGKRGRMFHRNLSMTIEPDGEEVFSSLSSTFLPAQVFRKPPEWNSCLIHVVGDHIRLSLNNVLANELIDHDTNHKSTGDAIALQFRPRDKYRFEVRNLRYRQLIETDATN